MIERQRLIALPFIVESTEVLNLQAKEKGLMLVFDLYDRPENVLETDIRRPSANASDEACGARDSDGDADKAMSSQRNLDPPGGISSYLSTSDLINVDRHKMNQVISNLISNAIKFTPVGQSVKIKARKVLPDVPDETERISFKNYGLSPVMRSVDQFKSPQTCKLDAEYDVELIGDNNIRSGGEDAHENKSTPKKRRKGKGNANSHIILYKFQNKENKEVIFYQSDHFISSLQSSLIHWLT